MAKTQLLVDKVVVSKNGMRQAVATVAEMRPLENKSNYEVVREILDTLGFDYVNPYE